MYHTRIQSGSNIRTFTAGELALRLFLSTHDAALGHAAALLAEQRGVRLIDTVREGLNQPGPLTTRLRRRPLDLRRLLFLEDDRAWEVPPLEPEDPAVPEIYLLTDGLEDAKQGAGIFPAENVQSGPAPLSCRSDCSFKRPFVRRPRGFTNPERSGAAADCRSH